MASKLMGKNGTKKRQTEIPGTAPADQVDDIDNAVADYLNFKEAAARMKGDLDKQKDELLELLRQHKRKVYIFRDGVMRWTVRLADKSQLKIQRDHDKQAEDVRPKRARATPAVG